jgi:acetyl esterase/lipase
MAEGSRPWRAWLLDATGVVLLLTALDTAWYMIHPVGAFGAGRLGYTALLFVPQLFLVALAALALAGLAWRRSAPVGAAIFALAAVIAAIMTIWPTAEEWRRARLYNVPVSLTAALIPNLSSNGLHGDVTVAYARMPDGAPLLLDIWRAPGAATALHPVIVKLHGGAWIHGHRGDSAGWNAFFNSLGYDVFDADYRAATSARWKDEIADAKCVIGWVVANAARYRVDPGRISVMGFSSGANLVLLAAYSMGDSRLPPSCLVPPVRIRAVVDLYGPSDLAEMYATSGSPDYVQPMLERYIGGPPAAFAARYRLVSPLAHVDARVPPTIILQGERDRVVPAAQAARLDAALAAAGVAHESYFFPWGDHGFDANLTAIATQVARTKVRNFLARHG